MAQVNENNVLVKKASSFASGLDEASSLIHELAILFGHMEREDGWVKDLSCHVSADESLNMAQNQLEAYNSLSRLAVNLLLGPVAESIQKTSDALRGQTSSN